MEWMKNLETGVFDYQLITIAGTPVTVATVVVFLVIVVITFIVSALFRRAATRAMKLRKIEDEGTVEVAKKLLHYLIVVTGLGIGLQTIGINLSALFAAGAVFAIGLGFAMQNIMQNFVSGVILLMERTIKPGDVLEVDGRFVRVSEMGIRSTIARTLDEEEIIIPNSLIVQSTVKNYTLQDALYRVRCPVGVVYGADMDQVRNVLEKTAADIQWRVEDKEPKILLDQFGSSSVDWEVSVWITDPWNMRRAKSELNEAIWWALKEADITIAFPQLDLHLDPPVVEALRRAG